MVGAATTATVGIPERVPLGLGGRAIERLTWMAVEASRPSSSKSSSSKSSSTMGLTRLPLGPSFAFSLISSMISSSCHFLPPLFKRGGVGRFKSRRSGTTGISSAPSFLAPPALCLGGVAVGMAAGSPGRGGLGRWISPPTDGLPVRCSGLVGAPALARLGLGGADGEPGSEDGLLTLLLTGCRSSSTRCERSRLRRGFSDVPTASVSGGFVASTLAGGATSWGF